MSIVITRDHLVRKLMQFPPDAEVHIQDNRFDEGECYELKPENVRMVECVEDDLPDYILLG